MIYEKMIYEIAIPDGKSGDWSVETFEVSKEDADFENMRVRIGARSARFIIAGKYKRLCYKGDIVMSNTPVEISDLDEFSDMAYGDVLLNGLGLGVALKIALGIKNVTSVTVIELSKDVINLVAPTYAKDQRVKIINADAYTWVPPKGKKYNVVWHDIWNTICADNLDGMEKLRRKYVKRCHWQGFWCREQLE